MASVCKWKKKSCPVTVGWRSRPKTPDGYFPFDFMNGQLEQLRTWGAVLLLGLTSPMLADAATSTGVSPIFTVDTRSVVDNDGDGIADDWELANGLSPTTPADANDDPDHDRLTNLQEYQLGLNPRFPDQPYLQPL